MSTGALLPRDVATRDGRRCRLRPQRETDAPGVVALDTEHPHSVLEEQVSVTAVAAEQGLGVVAEAPREGIVGHLVVSGPRRVDGGGEIAIFVHNAWRKAGLGRELLRLAVEWAGAHELPALRVRVDPMNEPARLLYTGLGFVAKEGDGSLDVVMELIL